MQYAGEEAGEEAGTLVGITGGMLAGMDSMAGVDSMAGMQAGEKPDLCATQICGPGFVCQPATGNCVDPCDDLVCPESQVCLLLKLLSIRCCPLHDAILNARCHFRNI